MSTMKKLTGDRAHAQIDYIVHCLNTPDDTASALAIVTELAHDYEIWKGANLAFVKNNKYMVDQCEESLNSALALYKGIKEKMINHGELSDDCAARDAIRELTGEASSRLLSMKGRFSRMLGHAQSLQHKTAPKITKPC